MAGTACKSLAGFNGGNAAKTALSLGFDLVCVPVSEVPVSSRTTRRPTTAQAPTNTGRTRTTAATTKATVPARTTAAAAATQATPDAFGVVQGDFVVDTAGVIQRCDELKNAPAIGALAPKDTSAARACADSVRADKNGRVSLYLKFPDVHYDGDRKSVIVNINGCSL